MNIVQIVKNKCMSLAVDDESKTFFYKMIGDYYRYVAESAHEQIREEVKMGAEEGYKQASEFSKGLNPYNVTRLGLALNFSVFYWEILNNHK